MHRYLGIVFLVIASGLTTSVDSVAKLWTDEIGGVQFAWGYFAANSVLLLTFAALRKAPIRSTLSTRRPVLQLARGAMLVGTISALFVGLNYLPLADVIVLSFATPLLLTVLAIPLLGERFSVHRLAAVIVGFLGVVVVLRPAASAWHWALTMPLISAVFFALFQIFTRKLAATENAITTLIYTGIGGLICSSVIVLFFWSPLNWTHAALFIGTGVLGVAAHLCMFRAYQLSEVTLLAPFNYVKLLWGVLFGYWLFSDWPAMHVFVGSAIIVASGIYVVVRERWDVAPGKV